MKLFSKISIIATLALFSCEDRFLDLKPLDSVTEAAYFKNSSHFEAATNNLYGHMIAWRPVNGTNIFDFTDFGSDLTALPQDVGRGSNLISNDDIYWTNTYRWLRDVNIVIEKAKSYTGDEAEIQEYVAAAHFFRAWHHFFLLQRFGGVPIVTEVVDINSPQLYGPRNSRYEVVEQIFSDLDVAIAGLPIEQNIEAANKGKISKWGAEAFKAKVLLYEATWEKYVGTTTDFEGSEGPKGDNINAYLDEAILLAKDVIDNGGYELWNYNNSLNGLSSYYLFNLEGGDSNPAGLDKSTNKEFIIQSIFDYDLRQGGKNISHTVPQRLSPSRKLLDMFLGSDGLPIDKSTVFQGYTKVSDEFANRDLRMKAYFENIPADGSPELQAPSSSVAGVGIHGRKFRSYNYGTYRAAEQESMNYPHLRLAEVYLIYAEALYERNGSISDGDLDISLNQLRQRAGIAPLTNALVNANGLDMLEEIRRERTIELFAESSRFNDLKRWGIAEEELNAPILGPVIEGTEYETNSNLYNPNLFIYGEKDVKVGDGSTRSTLVLDPASNRNFTRKNYLFPIPLAQIQLNPNLVQNPDW